MKRRLTLGVGLLFLLLPVTLRGEESKAEKSKLDLTQRYLLLDTMKRSTMQKELNEAAAAGYRVRAGLSAHILFLEKVAQPPDTYEYLLPGGGYRELNEAAVKGFRLLPRTERVMEKAPRSKSRYQYLDLSTMRTLAFSSRIGHLQEKLAQASQQGYEVVEVKVGGMMPEDSDEHFVTLEKRLETQEESPAPAAEQSKLDLSQRYRLLATNDTSAMRKELDEAAAAGYRVVTGSAATKENLLILEKVAAPTEPFQYMFLTVTKTSTMRKELNNVGAEGFRLLPSAMMAWKKFFLRVVENGMVMEKAPGCKDRFQYLLLAAGRISTLEKELTQASAQGYDFVGVASDYTGEIGIVILSKAL